MPTRKHFAAFIAAGVLISLSAGAFSLLNGQRTAVSSFAGIAVTIFPATAIPIATPEVSIAAAPPEPIAAAPAALVETPAAAPRAGQHVVKTGDSLWAIALAFGLPDIQGILAVNPGLNPDALTIDQVLNIPALDFVPPPQPTAALAQQGAHVKLDAGGLRLRNEPRVSDNVLTRLAQNAALEIVSRSTDAAWYEVVTSGNVRGWVQAQYVDIDPATGVVANRPALPGLLVAVGGVPVASGGSVAPLAAPVAAAPVLVAPVAAVAAPLEYPPYLSDISARVFDIYNAGQARGIQRNVFALIGDSNTENPKFFRPYDWGGYILDARFAYLEDTVRFFKGSFDHNSPAARGGFNTSKALDPGMTNDGRCSGGESPVGCELRIRQASVALILLGTGDQHSWQGFEGRYRQIIEQTIAYGTIPVLITKGDDLESRDNNAPYGYINSVIRRLAAEYQVPLLNLTQVLDTLPFRGFGPDGFHYNIPPDERAADFTPDKLIYGFNQRNLTALQALDAIRRRVIERTQ